MFKTIFATKDATLRSQFADQNDGTDPILEIVKSIAGTPSLENGDESVYYADTYNSRILLYFDLTAISQSVVSGKINSNALYYITLRTTEAISLPLNYTLYAYPISGSWVSGTGFFNSNPQITNGVSWRYRDSKLSGTLWPTASYNSGATGSYGSIPHGGNWYTASVASQTFDHAGPDVRMDVTTIVRQWLSGSIENNGFIIKLSDAVERDTSEFGSIKFFSTETHTIYVPRLEVYWDDSDLSGIGSFVQVPDEDFVLYTKNLRETYNENEVAKIKIGSRLRYPATTYSTSSNYLVSNRLPTGSYFQIQDHVTEEAIIPFHPSGTKVNCDSGGNYIKVDCNSLLPERYYKLVFKCEFDGGSTVRYIDDGHIFRITRS